MNWKCCEIDGCPDDYQLVFVVAKYCPMDEPYITAAYKEVFHWVDAVDGVELSDVTHWAPIRFPTRMPKEAKQYE